MGLWEDIGKVLDAYDKPHEPLITSNLIVQNVIKGIIEAQKHPKKRKRKRSS